MDSPSVFPINRLPPELLVSTLHHLAELSPFTLLHSQRVCRLWQTLITTSPTIQRDLYFRPSPPSFHQHPANADSPGDIESAEELFNPLLVPSFGPLFGKPQGALPPGFVRRGSGRGWRKRSEYPAFTLLPWLYTEGSRERVLRKEASWRRMMVCKRRIRRLASGHTQSGQLGYEFTTKIVEFGAGIGEEAQTPMEVNACGTGDDGKGNKRDSLEGSYDEEVGMTMQDFYDLLLSGDLCQGPEEFPSWTLFLGKTLSRWHNFEDYVTAGVIERDHSERTSAERERLPRLRYLDQYRHMFHYLEDSPTEEEGEYGEIDTVLLSGAITQCSVGLPLEREHAKFRIPGEALVRRYKIRQIYSEYQEQ